MTDLRSAYGLMSDDFSYGGSQDSGGYAGYGEVPAAVPAHGQNFGHGLPGPPGSPASGSLAGPPPPPPMLQSIQDAVPSQRPPTSSGMSGPQIQGRGYPSAAAGGTQGGPAYGGQQQQQQQQQSTYIRPPSGRQQQQAQATQAIPMVPMVPAVPIQVQSSYVDTLVSKKKDMAKLVLMGLVILFAISAHSVIDFSLRNFIVDQGLSFRQEIGLRMLYPALVIMILWHLRAFSTSAKEKKD